MPTSFQKVWKIQKIWTDEFKESTSERNYPFPIAEIDWTERFDRHYDPETGRWTNKDPIGFAGGSTGLYAYCGNDPVNCVDPSGLWTLQVGISFSGTVLGVNINVNVGVAVDTQGNVGFYQTGGASLGGGASASEGLSATVTNADTIGQLGGTFTNTTVTAGAGVGGSVEVINGNSGGQQITGVGFTVGPTVGASVSGGASYTTIQSAPHCP